MGVEVTQENFKTKVIQASESKHILVDFWAKWCKPCQVLTPMLESLEEEYQGRFSLAKINTEDEPDIAIEFNVVSIPNIKLFYQGDIIDQFVGVISEKMIRDFLEQNIPPAEIGQIEELIQTGSFEEAFGMLVKQKIENETVQDMFWKIILHCIADLPNSIDELVAIVKHLPNVGKYSMAKDSLMNFLSMEQADENIVQLRNLVEKPSSRDPLDHFLRGVGSLSGEAQRIAREGLLVCLHILGNENPLSMEYRKKLSQLIY